MTNKYKNLTNKYKNLTNKYKNLTNKYKNLTNDQSPIHRFRGKKGLNLFPERKYLINCKFNVLSGNDLKMIELT